jgi:hypothetical protein
MQEKKRKVSELVSHETFMRKEMVYHADLEKGIGDIRL